MPICKWAKGCDALAANSFGFFFSEFAVALQNTLSPLGRTSVELKDSFAFMNEHAEKNAMVSTLMSYNSSQQVWEQAKDMMEKQTGDNTLHDQITSTAAALVQQLEQSKPDKPEDM